MGAVAPKLLVEPTCGGASSGARGSRSSCTTRCAPGHPTSPLFSMRDSATGFGCAASRYLEARSATWGPTRRFSSWTRSHVSPDLRRPCTAAGHGQCRTGRPGHGPDTPDADGFRSTRGRPRARRSLPSIRIDSRGSVYVRPFCLGQPAGGVRQPPQQLEVNAVGHRLRKVRLNPGLWVGVNLSIALLQQ
jgi:hypothetical protein